MNPEFSEFISANGTAVVIVLGLLAAVGLVQWRKVRLAEQEQDYKQTLLDKGVPPAEVEKILAAKSPRRRGLLEQFGELSGGGKAGVVVVIIVVVSVITGSISAILHSHTFAEQIRAHQAARQHEPPALALQTPPAQFDTFTGNAFYLDLQPVTNQKLTDVVGEGHSLASLPQKRREFGGVPFQVGPGYVRLRGKINKDLPPEVNEIRVGFKFDKLHILHGTEFGAFGGSDHHYRVSEGTEIGYYRVGYSDEQEVRIPVIYGEDVRDSWNWDKSRQTKRGKVVWTGSSPGTVKEGVSLRLYLMTWENPRPGEEVSHIDFVSAGNTAASPFCIALTTERKTK